LLLNDKPVFPPLAPSGRHVGTVYAAQLTPNYTRTNLDTAIACTQQPCEQRTGTGCWCIEPSLSSVGLDYDYGVEQLQADPLQWKITFDAIAGQDGLMRDPVWGFNQSEQQMLLIVVEGREIKQEKKTSMSDSQASSTLFGPFGEEQETKYELEIIQVNLVPRSYTFPDPPLSTFWSRLKHFFGSDPAPPKGHVIYHQEEWGPWGKKGTLRNKIGEIIYDWPWDLVGIIIASVLAGLLAAYGVYRLVLVILEQRRLAQWGGMDEVWRQIREGGDGDDEEGLLDARYKDDPDDAQLLRYTDDVTVNKPLPSKPLPEKPLPDVPLIDDL
jgi:hypothetical protein